MGRTGSDYHQTAVARQVGDTTAGMDYQRLQDERARQVEANSLMDQMRQAGMGLGLNAANSASAIQGSNYDRQLGAAGEVPGAYQATLSPYQTITGIGQQQDADLAAKRGAPGYNLSSLAQLLGMSQGFGTTTGAVKQPSNTFGQIAGGGLGLASLLFG
jgi:hypothetical protein